VIGRFQVVLAAACLAGLSCGSPSPQEAGVSPAPATTPPAPAATPQASAAAPLAAKHLRVDNATFRTADGRLFQWRGISAFRLLDYVADGNEAEMEKYLAWARGQRLTVVRVLAMGSSFMELKPSEGRAALPRLLLLAAKHGLHVEVVALADTRALTVDLDEHLSDVGRIVGGHPNALLEVANEPTHATQAPAVGEAAGLMALAARLPADVPVALGSVEADEDFAGPDYATWHAPRDSKQDGWGHVLGLAEGAELVRKLRKPVISDEPIGAGPKYEPGRRDDAPARFRGAALLTRLAGLGATFHYSGGLQARIPEGRELQCFDAWNEAWTLLPADVEIQGTFAVSGTTDTVVQAFDRTTAFGVFERIADSRGWVLAVGPGDPALRLAAGWSVQESRTFEGVRLITVAR
jgi:hypothetical protein